MKKIFLVIIAFLIMTGSVYATPTMRDGQVYSYQMMEEDLRILAKGYPDLIQIKVFGYSEMGNKLYAVRLGTDKPSDIYIPNILYNGSSHAREWPSTMIAIDKLYYYAEQYKNGNPNFSILEKCYLWFIPMLNPDGVTLQQSGLDQIPGKYHANLLSLNNNSRNFTHWKSDILGIDINRNFPLPHFESSDVPTYASENSKGTFPGESVEVAQIMEFINEINPLLLLDYHSSGRVIFWGRYSKNNVGAGLFYRTKDIAVLVHNINTYRYDFEYNLGAGLSITAWFRNRYNKPAVTVELFPYAGRTNPNIANYPAEFELNKDVSIKMLEYKYNVFNERGGAYFEAYLEEAIERERRQKIDEALDRLLRKASDEELEEIIQRIELKRGQLEDREKTVEKKSHLNYFASWLIPSTLMVVKKIPTR